jgi:hypothetical protein
VELVIEDEQILGRAVAGAVALRVLEQLCLADFEEGSVNLVHREERGGETARTPEETPAVHVQLL